jgi:hypothetical protein
MRCTWKVLLKLSFLWTTTSGVGAEAETYDFGVFSKKLTKQEYQERFEKYAAANGRHCDSKVYPRFIAYLKQYFVESDEGLTVQIPGEKTLCTIPWKTEGAEAVSTAPDRSTRYTLILDPGLERRGIRFTKNGELQGTFDYADTMDRAVDLLEARLRQNLHPRIDDIASTRNTVPTPTTTLESKAEAARLVAHAQTQGSTPLVLSIHMNVNPIPSAVTGQVELSTLFPHIVTFVPGAYMAGELKNEDQRLYLFVKQLFSHIPASIRLAESLSVELEKKFPSHTRLTAEHASEIKAFDLHTRPLSDVPGVQCRNLSMTSLDSACVYGFGPCYNHPTVWESCSQQRDDGTPEIAVMLADAYEAAIRRFLDGPASFVQATVTE